jgi:hypothetical protein
MLIMGMVFVSFKPATNRADESTRQQPYVFSAATSPSS